MNRLSVWGKIARKGKGKGGATGLFAFPSPHAARLKACSQARLPVAGTSGVPLCHFDLRHPGQWKRFLLLVNWGLILRCLQV